MPNKFPDEDRDTLERLLRSQAKEASFRNLSTLPRFEYLLARIRSPDFGLCRKCGSVLSLSRLVNDVTINECENCATGAG